MVGAAVEQGSKMGSERSSHGFAVREPKATQEQHQQRDRVSIVVHVANA
jgi:hypothetical protein